MTPASGGWYSAGTPVTLSENPNLGFTFSSFTNTGGTLSGSTLTITAPASVTANFTAPSYTQTIASSPAGLTLTVDSAACTTPCTYSWMQGTVHSVAAAGPQSGGTGVQYVLASWSDNGAAAHTITAPSSARTYTANFTTQYYLTTSASPSSGGTISPATGWQNAGTAVTLSATPASGYALGSFSANGGTLSGSTLTMEDRPNTTAACLRVTLMCPTSRLHRKPRSIPSGYWRCFLMAATMS